MEFQLIVLSAEVTFGIVVVSFAAGGGGVLTKWTVPIYQTKMLVIQASSQRFHLFSIDNNYH